MKSLYVAFAWLLATRVWAGVWMVLGSYWPRPDDDLHWSSGTEGFFWEFVPIRLLDVWGRWDSVYYVSLADRGYPSGYAEGGPVYHAAYFPFYPILMRGLSELLGGASTYLCGLFISNLLLALAMFYFVRLCAMDADAPGSLPASDSLRTLPAILLLAYPGSHFLSCIYPESTALFLAVFTLYCARAGKLGLATVGASFAVLTRSNGIFLLLALAYELGMPKERSGFRFSVRHLWLFVPIAFVLLWLGFHHQQYGNALYFAEVLKSWNRKPSYPWATLFRTDVSFDYHLIVVLGLAVAAYGTLQRMRPGHLLLAWTNVLLPLSTGILKGVHRYSATNFPLFTSAALFFRNNPSLKWLYWAAGLSAMAIYAFRWGQGYQPN